MKQVDEGESDAVASAVTRLSRSCEIRVIENRVIRKTELMEEIGCHILFAPRGSQHAHAKVPLCIERSSLR
jgi:hypothetical protein